jgi:C4-dicarboxylate transporter DctM subunit
MEWYTSLITIIGLFFVFLLLGIPVNYSLGLSFIPILLFLSDEPASYVFNLFGMMTFRKLNSIVLVAVPLFILMGQIFARTNIGFRMYEGFRRWLCWMPGGLAVTTVLSNTFFAAICGASMIAAGTTGPISILSMLKNNYSPRLAAGAACSASVLAMLIPPSIPGIFYCVITEQSIGQLFMAGLVPGLLMATLFIVSILVRVKLHPELAPKSEKATMKEKVEALPWMAGPVGLIFLILFSLYSGLAGVNEMAAIGVAGALILAMAYREMNRSTLVLAVMQCVRFIGFFSMIFVCANFMGFGFTYFGINQAFSEWVGSLEVNRIVILVILMATYLLMGMVMDASALILVSMPVIFPIIQELGFDPIWFGILLILNLEIGAITPPVGVNLFALKAAIPELDLKDAVFGSFPFIAIIVLVMVLMIIFPDLALWLPAKMVG